MVIVAITRMFVRAKRKIRLNMKKTSRFQGIILRGLGTRAPP
jgi:hypothetical protein